MSKNILIISTSLKKAHLSGTVFTGGVDAAGEAKGHVSLVKAFELGRNI